jgi:hypothetical protein
MMMSLLPTRPTPPPTHRHRAVVDRGEGGETTLVGTDECIEAVGVLHLLDVDTGVEAPTFGAQHDHAHRRITSESSDGVGESEPLGHGEGIDGRTVHDHFGDAAVVDLRSDSHGGEATRHLTKRQKRRRVRH